MKLPMWGVKDPVLVTACLNALKLFSEPGSKEPLFSQMPYMPWDWPVAVLL